MDKTDAHARKNAGKPFNDGYLTREGYQLSWTFRYMLPDGTILCEHLRYDLDPKAPGAPAAILNPPKKRFVTRRPLGNLWVFGASDRRVPYRWGDIVHAGPGATVFIPEGDGKCEALAKAGYLATTVLAHNWTPECVAALTGHLIILADHDEVGRDYAKEAAAALSSVAASIRVVDYWHLWLHLNPNQRGPEPDIHEDIKDWLERRGGDPTKLLEICLEVPVEGGELEEWDAGETLEGGKEEPRQWLIYGQMCRRVLSGLVAPGDTGKTSLRIMQAIELATGRALLGYKVFRRRKVLIVGFEDDAMELRRRIRAACTHHRISPTELKGWLFCRALNSGPKFAELDSKGKKRVAGKLDRMLRRAIKRIGCDLLVLDPFVRIHALNENDNPDMDFVCAQLIKLAQECNIAVDSPAHTHKGAIAAGDADARRGASAQRDAGRLDWTLTVMSEDEAEQFGIPEDERKQHVRLDKAKANMVRSMKAHWFKLVNVPLNNGNDEYPDGDEVQAIEQWVAPDTWYGVTVEVINAILDDIEQGLPDGRRYSDHGSAGEDRKAWPVVQRHCIGKTEAQCREMIRSWLKQKVLYRNKYERPNHGDEETGLYVDNSKRSGRGAAAA
jgi:hypothetical protein